VDNFGSVKFRADLSSQ